MSMDIYTMDILYRKCNRVYTSKFLVYWHTYNAIYDGTSYIDDEHSTCTYIRKMYVFVSPIKPYCGLHSAKFSHSCRFSISPTGNNTENMPGKYQNISDAERGDLHRNCSIAYGSAATSVAE